MKEIKVYLKEQYLREISEKCIMKASITVEATLIMPLVLACIMLLIIMNGYLHDTVILNNASIVALYSDMENKETVFYEEIQHRSLWIENVEFSEKEDLFDRTISWRKTYLLPLKGLLSMVIGETEIDLSGTVQKEVWSIIQIMRYVKQD